MKYGEQFERESVPGWSLRTFFLSFLALLIYALCLSRESWVCLPLVSETDGLINSLLLCKLTDNIDYNSLKHHIKVHTTRDQATAIAIPGHHDAPLAKFEDDLFAELCRQHDRVDMFVTSKADEISRRLGKIS